MTETMTAGREMDALIAEKVMGWERQMGSGAGTNEWHDEAVMLIAPDWKYRRYPTSSPVTYFDNVPLYSTDIAAAWLVVERLGQDENTYVEVSQYQEATGILDEHGPYFTKAWQCVVQYTVGERAQDVGMGDTPALAICRAALAAIG